MDELFSYRVLTAAVNQMKAPARKIFNRFFAPVAKGVPSGLIQFDVISGSEEVLGRIRLDEPSTFENNTHRVTKTLEAPKISNKRLILDSDIQDYRKIGSKMSVEMMKDRIAQEQLDMLNKHYRTLEFWSANALRGAIYDSDLSTVLVDYGLATTHTTDLTGTDLWSDTGSQPINKLRYLKKLIEDDCDTEIKSWVAYMGSEAMDALLEHADTKAWLDGTMEGVKVIEDGRIARIAGIELIEYNGSFLSGSTRYRFIETDHMLLIGVCDNMVECPYGTLAYKSAPGGIGNQVNGQMAMFFSDAEKKWDPDGMFIRVSARPVPVLKRPDAVWYAKVTA